MTQETLGYVKLEWICTKCGNRNPGPEMTCRSCGAPQPENVQFIEAQAEVAAQDEGLRKIAEAGPDIHCPFCGTRNPAGAETCSQCGGDLREGKKREAGRVVGAYRPEPEKTIRCPNCQTENPAKALNCSNCGAALVQAAAFAVPTATQAGGTPPRSSRMGIGIVILLVVLCVIGIIAYMALSAPRESLTASVAAVEWQTSVQVLELGPVTHETWREDIPREAPVGRCVEKVYQISSSEPFGEKFNKICGTPYTIDTGSGVGRVVQDCQFEVIRLFCAYTVDEWRVIDVERLSGTDLSPDFANPTLSSHQRLGDTSASYAVIFQAEDGQYTYHVSSLDEFRQFPVGSEWMLNINALGQIVSIEPPE